MRSSCNNGWGLHFSAFSFKLIGLLALNVQSVYVYTCTVRCTVCMHMYRNSPSKLHGFHEPKGWIGAYVEKPFVRIAYVYATVESSEMGVDTYKKMGAYSEHCRYISTHKVMIWSWHCSLCTYVYTHMYIITLSFSRCAYLPNNGAFFVAYVITVTFVGTAVELLRMPELVCYVYRRLLAKTRQQRQQALRKVMLWSWLGKNTSHMLIVV